MASVTGRLMQEWRRFLRFVAVGILNTLFGYSVFGLLYLATHSHYFAITLATAVGIVFNFRTTGRIVFADRGGKAFIPFALGYGVVLVVNLALVDCLLAFNMSAMMAQAVSLPLIVALSFAINALIVFRRPTQNPGI